MTIQEIKNNYDYRYAHIDFYNVNEDCGYLYSLNNTKYFVNLKETYIKEVSEDLQEC